MRSISSAFQPLIGPSGHSVLFGAKRGSSFKDLLKGANSVCLATAFLTETGRKQLEKCLSSSARLRCLIGTNFLQTEPYALKKLNRRNRTYVKIAITNSRMVFHPKVFIVPNSKRSFAIVGSANVTNGGLLNNIECSLLTDDDSEISNLSKWFLSLWNNKIDDIEIVDLDTSSDWFRNYSNSYRSAKRKRKWLQNSAEKSRKTVLASHHSKSLKWEKLVRKARRRKDTIRKNSSKWQNARDDIKKVLHYRNFSGITHDEWAEFYKIAELGKLIPIHRNEIFRQNRKLQQALRCLVNESKSIEERYERVRNPKDLGIKHLGRNIISKILAAHNPKLYPVWNAPVDEVLGEYGYRHRENAKEWEKYAELADKMRSLLKETGLRDMIDLDYFFWELWEESRHGTEDRI